MKSEKVLLVKRNKFPKEWLEKEVALKCTTEDLYNIIPNNRMKWIERHIAEKNIKHKQIIPYVLVYHIETESFACYPRSGSEDRLHGLWSLGVGGHINQDDECVCIISTIVEGMCRELKEEFIDFEWDEDSDLILKGIINEEKSEVGNVHIGVVYLYKIESRPLPDKELNGLVWIKKEDFKNYQLELWSKLAIKLL